MSEDTQFKKGNKAAQAMSDEAMENMFHEMIEYAMDDANEALALQDVYLKFNMGKSTFCYRCSKNENLAELKESICDAITARVNRGAMKGEYVPSPSIWRLKQLGEKDSSSINHNHSGNMITEHKVIFEDYSDE